MKVGGVELETEEIAGAEPALVFLHEGLGSVALWRDFPARLAAATGRRALLYSRAGHGFSDVPDGDRTPRFMHDEALDVLPALLREAGIERPVLVGHSDGGSIALIHASEHAVERLILLAPHVFVEDVTVASIEEARTTFETTDLGERMARYHRDAERTFRLWNDIWLAPEFRSWNIEDVLPGVSAPTLLIQGEHDQYGTLAQIEAIERGVQRPVQRAVLDCRHAPHLEAPDATLDAATASCRDGPRASTSSSRSSAASTRRYGLEYLSPTHGRVTIEPALLGRRRHRSERDLRGDRRVAGVHRDRRRGRPAGLLPVRLEQRHARRRRGPRGCPGRHRPFRARGEGEWLWDVEIGPPGAAATAIATVVIAVRKLRV